MNSKCPNSECQSVNAFEHVGFTPKGSLYEVGLIQCAGCGTVVGVVTDGLMRALLEKHAQVLVAQTDKIGTLLAEGLTEIVGLLGGDVPKR